MRAIVFAALLSISKTAEMTARSAPERMTSVEAFSPSSKRERVDQDGFAGARFAGQQVESGGEGHRYVIDDRVVLEAQFDEHRGSWVCEVERSIA